MPLPLVIGAVIAGTVGVGAGIHGASKMKKADATINNAKDKHKQNIERFEHQHETTTSIMDKLGELELKILASFGKFSAAIEKIQGLPEFEAYNKNSVNIPKYKYSDFGIISFRASLKLGVIRGAAAGRAGAIAGAIAAAGTAGTSVAGTAIASLSGVTATNTTLATLGGGSIAVGVGGIALGATMLGATTFGVSFLVGGITFNVLGSNLSDKADEAWAQMKKTEEEIDKIMPYLIDLNNIADKYFTTMSKVQSAYDTNLNALMYTVTQKTDWSTFTDEQKMFTENTVLLVGLLYKMCRVQLISVAEDVTALNTINENAINESIDDANIILSDENITSFAEIPSAIWESIEKCKSKSIFQAFMGRLRTVGKNILEDL